MLLKSNKRLPNSRNAPNLPRRTVSRIGLPSPPGRCPAPSFLLHAAKGSMPRHSVHALLAGKVCAFRCGRPILHMLIKDHSQLLEVSVARRSLKVPGGSPCAHRTRSCSTATTPNLKPFLWTKTPMPVLDRCETLRDRELESGSAATNCISNTPVT